MQGKSAKFTFSENPISHPPERGQRSPTRFEFLKDMKWQIFLKINDNSIKEELYKRLEENRFVYNPYLGLQSLFARIKDCKLIEMELSNDISDNIYTSFDRNLIKFKIKKPVAFYNELIPVSFEIDRSLPKTKEMISFVGEYEIEITNKDDLQGKLYQDDDRRVYQFI